MRVKVFLFLMCIPFYLGAQQVPRPSQKSEKVFHLLYSNKFLSADSALSEIKDLPDFYLLKANISWWQIVSGNDKELWSAHSHRALKSLEDYYSKIKLKSLTDKEIFNFISLHALKARTEFLDNNYLSGFTYLNQGLKYIKLSCNSEYPYFKLTNGLYNYFMAKARETYPLLSPYFTLYPKSDKALGIAYLKTLTRNNDLFLSTEANYFLMKVYFEGENKPGIAELYAKQLIKKFPENILYQYYLFKIYLAQDKLDEANFQQRLISKYSLENEQLNNLQKNHFIDLCKVAMAKYLKESN